MSLRIALSNLVQNFDISFATGEDGSNFENDALDTFVAANLVLFDRVKFGYEFRRHMDARWRDIYRISPITYDVLVVFYSMKFKPSRDQPAILPDIPAS